MLVVHEVQKHCDIDLANYKIKKLILDFVHEANPNNDKLVTLIGKVIRISKKSQVNKQTVAKHSNCFHLNRAPLEYKPLSNLQVEQAKLLYRYK